MSSLAEPSDISARLGRDLTDAETARVTALLDDASALVRAYTRQQFDLVSDEEVILRCHSGEIPLPQHPVTEVSEVKAIGFLGTADFVMADWVFDGIDKILLGTGAAIINLPAWWWDEDVYPGSFKVTYSHGYTDIPPEVVLVVARVVTRTLTSPGLAGGVASETVGPFSYRLDQSSIGGGLAVALTQDDKDLLCAYRQEVGSTYLRRG